MSDIATLEKRVTDLESELATLKRQLASERRGGDWISRITGSFKDDPEFAEIVRLGREIRRADRPGDPE